ncbi:MAG TPA: thioredoxin domain-containing protein [Aeromicrobium sp.]|nr:thioredoxin domain-containing protein [Aeromicrobium sp.]
MPNRLAESTSPYLLQHADNPVDWHEWGDEAFALAQSLERPILLSVGYSACHWCHVMAHESFEDPVTAAYMNDHFVNVKVDREERPDVDAVYMQATQAMTGHGGWPMTCVLTPDGEPFFAGTYFPPEPRHGMPAFTQILQALAEAWRTRRSDVLGASREAVQHLRTKTPIEASAIGAPELDEAARSLATQYDAEAGGFGSAPKFPPTMVLEFLLRQHARSGDERSLAMVRKSADAMARGGIYDQLGGGFARYSVDRFWRVPHFEKMLYDNAQLLRFFLHCAGRAGADERIARETADFLLAELATEQGGFASALDADSANQEGEVHEGTYYVWNPAQLVDALGEEDGAWAAALLQVTPDGTFERGFSTLQLLRDPDDPERWSGVRARLLDARAKRPRPARDDKVVAAWNGLAISALAEASVLLDDDRYAEAAVSAARLLVEVHGAGTDAFVRTSRDGVAGRTAAVLEDHGCVAEAFLAVLGITGDAVWLERAQALLDRALAHFGDGDGGWFDTADDAEQLVVRPQDPSDNAHPSGASALITALVAHAALTGEHRYRQAADTGLSRLAVLVARAPRFAGWSMAAAELLLAGPVEVAVVGRDGAARRALHRAALGMPAAVVVAGEPGLGIPLFDQRTEIDGQPAAYVCRDFVCDLPVTDPRSLGTPAG